MAEHDEKRGPGELQGSDGAGAGEPQGLKRGWIEDLALRSSGVPQPENPSAKDKEQSPWRFAGFGLQFAGLVILFTFMGYEIDKRMGWFPWMTVTLSMLAVIGNMYLLIKELVIGPQRGSNKKKT